MPRQPAHDSRLLHLLAVAGTFAAAIQGASTAAVKGLNALAIMLISLMMTKSRAAMRELWPSAIKPCCRRRAAGPGRHSQPDSLETALSRHGSPP